MRLLRFAAVGLVLAILGWASVAAAAEGRPRPGLQHAVGADYGPFLYLAPGLPFSAGGASLYYRLRLPSGIALAGGLRILHVDRLPDGVGVEGFVGVHLAPRLGPWRPLTGLDLGVTSLQSQRLSLEPRYGPEEYTPRLLPLGPAYVAWVAAPLRFAVWHLVFQAVGLQLGTHLPQPGSALRLQLVLAQLEWSF